MWRFFYFPPCDYFCDKIYKKIAVAKETGDLDFTDKQQFLDLVGSINTSSFHQNKELSIAVGTWEVFQYNEEGYYTGSFDAYGVTGVTKSGKVYRATEDTGGVAEVVQDWQAIIDSHQVTIDTYKGYLEDPEYADADWWIQPYIDYFESEIQKMRGFIARGVTYDWTLSTMARENCALSTDPDSVCIYEPYVPMTLQSGYVFDPQAQAWRTFTVPSSDS